MAELQQFSEKKLQSKFDDKNGSWLYNIARGIDLEPVQARFNPKSIGCCKQFRGKTALVDLESLKKWLKDLGDEIEDRLEKDALENNRTPKQMVVSFSAQLLDGRDSSSSRSYNFSTDDELCGVLFSNKAFELLMDSAEGCKPKDDESNRRLKAPIKFLGISVGKFEDNNESKKTKKILDYFGAGGPSKENTQKVSENTAKYKDKTNERSDCTLRKFLTTPKDDKKLNKDCTENNDDRPGVLESTLDKQESFFAKFLNKNHEPNKHGLKQEYQKNPIETRSEQTRPYTPECNIIPEGDGSNDTDYSGSTINDEINKSIALFEEDPDEVTRVSSMRQLLNNSEKFKIENDVEEIKLASHTQSTSVSPLLNPKSHIVSTDCSECGKTIPLNKLEEHADYHLALRLREEERQEVRKARERNLVKEVHKQDTKENKQVSKEFNNKNEPISITNFLTKIDDSVPTKICPECGKRIVEGKYSEHQDFHEAQKLSRQLNNRQSSNISTTCVKRKRKSSSPTKKTKLQCKSIDLFFR